MPITTSVHPIQMHADYCLIPGKTARQVAQHQEAAFNTWLPSIADVRRAALLVVLWSLFTRRCAFWNASVSQNDYILTSASDCTHYVAYEQQLW